MDLDLLGDRGFTFSIGLRGLPSEEDADFDKLLFLDFTGDCDLDLDLDLDLELDFLSEGSLSLPRGPSRDWSFSLKEVRLSTGDLLCFGLWL